MEEVKSSEFANVDKISKLLAKVIKSVGTSKLTVAELILFVSNLNYSIGASIEGKTMSMDELEKAYYSNPTVGVAMMLDGLTISTWFDSYVAQLKSQTPQVESTEIKEK